MRWFVRGAAALVVAGALVACQESSVLTAEQQAVLATRNACLVLARSLSMATVAASQGRLTAEQIETINIGLELVDPICSAPVPPADGEEAVKMVNEMLERVLFAAGGAPAGEGQGEPGKSL